MFNPDKCYIPTVYCGNKEKKYPYVEKDNRYLGQGTPHQCMRKGFGASIARENKKNIPVSSLQNIRYVGPKFEEAFQKEGIATLNQLLIFIQNNPVQTTKTMLERVFRNANGSLNGKGFNSTLLYLYRNGNKQLPGCVDIDQ
jgi:hypothetical protein